MPADVVWWGGGAVVVLAVLLWARRRRPGGLPGGDDVEDLAGAAAREGWVVPGDPAAAETVANTLNALGPDRPLAVFGLAAAVRHSREVRCFEWGWRQRAGRRGALAALPAVSLTRLATALGDAEPAGPLPGRAAPSRTEPADHLRRTAGPSFAAAEVELTVGALRTGDDGPRVPAALRVAGTERAPERAAVLVAALREAAAALPPAGRLQVVTGGTALFLGTSDGAGVPWEVLMRTVERLVGAIEAVER